MLDNHETLRTLALNILSELEKERGECSLNLAINTTCALIDKIDSM